MSHFAGLSIHLSHIILLVTEHKITLFITLIDRIATLVVTYMIYHRHKDLTIWCESQPQLLLYLLGCLFDYKKDRTLCTIVWLECISM